VQSGQAAPFDETGSLDEAGRLAAVRRYEILDTPPDGAFDRIAALAARWLNTPLASVTIVDEDRIWFKALQGLEGVREIPREPGLCASAICSDRTTVIPDTLADPVAASNSLVTGPLGVRFYAAAPVVTADGYRLGTVNVIDTRPRAITEAAMATLADLAAVVTDELELRLSALRAVRAEQRRRDAERLRAEAERAARQQADHDKAALSALAATLRQTLLPPALPAIPGMDLACHYRPVSAQAIGGDFYDVFALDARRWGFFIGDVCGKGAPAAALTSLARYTLRAAAHHHPGDPAAVLAALNEALLADPAVDGRFCTAIYGILEPAESAAAEVTLAAGGHPSPFRLRPSADRGHTLARPVQMPGGMLIGAASRAHFTMTAFRLEPGESLLLYTDGLTDTRASTGGLLGEDGLAAFLTAHGGGPLTAGTLVTRVTALLDQLSAGVRDDVALLAIAVPAHG
jgi:sigma-B regulation protein RsbU (phosphoserine phosphatase)